MELKVEVEEMLQSVTWMGKGAKRKNRPAEMSRAVCVLLSDKTGYNCRCVRAKATRQLELGGPDAAMFSKITLRVGTDTPEGNGWPPRLLICWMAASGNADGVFVGIDVSLNKMDKGDGETV
jgi:hypothetical protein